MLTTERTRKLLLKIVVEGYLSEPESVATWDKKLQDLMREHADDPNVNRILWNALTAQVGMLPSDHHASFLQCVLACCMLLHGLWGTHMCMHRHMCAALL